MDWQKLLDIAEREVAATIAELPPPVRKAVREVPILIESVPTPEDVRGGIESDTLGYFDEDAAGVFRIRLWLDNIWDYAGGRTQDFAEELRITLLHEIGHVLGWDEDELESRGLE